MKEDIVYEVIFDYSTEDCNGVDTYIFESYKSAVNKMKEIIDLEKQPDMSWVGDAMINNTFEYDLDTNIKDINDNEEIELWWNMIKRDDWYVHDFIDLRIKEIL